MWRGGSRAAFGHLGFHALIICNAVARCNITCGGAFELHRTHFLQNGECKATIGRYTGFIGTSEDLTHFFAHRFAQRKKVAKSCK